MLAAAAVSFASRLPDLVKLGAEAIRIAFRMGLRVDQVSQRLEARRAEGPAESWAYVFSELSEDEVQKELATMNASLVSVLSKSLSSPVNPLLNPLELPCAEPNLC